MIINDYFTNCLTFYNNDTRLPLSASLRYSSSPPIPVWSHRVTSQTVKIALSCLDILQNALEWPQHSVSEPQLTVLPSMFFFVFCFTCVCTLVSIFLISYALLVRMSSFFFNEVSILFLGNFLKWFLKHWKLAPKASHGFIQRRLPQKTTTFSTLLFLGKWESIKDTQK